MLRERNKSYGTIKFVDISAEDYSAEDNQGLDYKTVSNSTMNLHMLTCDLYQKEMMIGLKKNKDRNQVHYGYLS